MAEWYVQHTTKACWGYAHTQTHTWLPVAKQTLGETHPAVFVDDMSNVQFDKQTKEVYAVRRPQQNIPQATNCG